MNSRIAINSLCCGARGDAKPPGVIWKGNETNFQRSSDNNMARDRLGAHPCGVEHC